MDDPSVFKARLVTMRILFRSISSHIPGRWGVRVLQRVAGLPSNACSRFSAPLVTLLWMALRLRLVSGVAVLSVTS